MPVSEEEVEASVLGWHNSKRKRYGFPLLAHVRTPSYDLVKESGEDMRAALEAAAKVREQSKAIVGEGKSE